VAHAYNSSYSGGRDEEDNGLRPGQKKRRKVRETISTNKPGMVIYNCNPSYAGAIGRSIHV
jgi:hypothetical protein